MEKKGRPNYKPLDFWASDPRVQATRAERAYRQSFEGRMEAVANPTRIDSRISNPSYTSTGFGDFIDQDPRASEGMQALRNAGLAGDIFIGK